MRKEIILLILGIMIGSSLLTTVFYKLNFYEMYSLKSYLFMNITIEVITLTVLYLIVISLFRYSFSSNLFIIGIILGLLSVGIEKVYSSSMANITLSPILGFVVLFILLPAISFSIGIGLDKIISKIK